VPLSQLPNLISAGRLIAMPVLLATALQRRPVAFAWLLLACLLSDIADGLIARHYHLESKLGAALDSTADLVLTLTAVYGMVVLQPAFVAGHLVALGIVASLYAGQVVLALLRYRRLSSFHTYATRASAYAQGVFFVGLFFYGYMPWLFYTAWVVSCVAYLEEWMIVAVLPRWTHDVRGLYWVLKARKD
jgi:phosphatidylglycerophosphate synthase